MANTDTQRNAHEFLLEHLQSQQPFKIAEFAAATGWDKPGTLGTHLRKHYKGLIEDVAGSPGGKFKVSDTAYYRVTESFRKLIPWRKFRQHVTQVRRVVTNYEPRTSKALIFDFLMPLSNEAVLRMTLDALFFKNSLLARLNTIPEAALSQYFPRPPGQQDVEYFNGILEFIKDRFAGYSISHVSGRFRSGKLRSQEETAAFESKGNRYLIDETTAITRLIFPFQSADELKKIRYLFQALFVRSIIQLVNGEEQIWMLESRSRVHIWQALGEDDNDDEEDDEGEDE